MGKISLSIRLDSDLVKRLDARKTKTKNRSDVIAELLYSAVDRLDGKSKDLNQEQQIAQSKSQVDLLGKGARAAIMSLRILELATEQHSEHADAIFKKAQELYRQEKNSEARSQVEVDDVYI